MPLHALIIHVFWNDSIFAQTVFKMFFFFLGSSCTRPKLICHVRVKPWLFFFWKRILANFFLGWFHTPIHWNQGITRLANAMKLLRQWAHPNFQKWSQGCRKMSLQQTLVYIYIQGKLPPLQLLPMILHSKIFHICNFAIYCDLFGDTWWCPVVPNWKGRNGDLQLFWGGSFIEFIFLVWWPVFGLLVSFCRFKESKWSFLATSGGLNDVCFLVNFWGWTSEQEVWCRIMLCHRHVHFLYAVGIFWTNNDACTIVGLSPFPVMVTTRIIKCLVGGPCKICKPSFVWFVKEGQLKV